MYPVSKLNLGAGGQVVEGWTNIDKGCGPGIFCADLTDPLPFPDGSARVAVAHHVLDMLDEPDLHALLGEVTRVLEPGGVLRISSPDFTHAMRALAEGDDNWFYRLGVPLRGSLGISKPAAREDAVRSAFAWYLDWGGARRTILYSPEHLGVEYLEPAGLKWERVGFHETVASMPSICDLDTREGESFFVDAVKGRA